MAKVLLLDIEGSTNILNDVIAAIDVAQPTWLTKVVDASRLTCSEVLAVVKQERSTVVVLSSGDQPVVERVVPIVSAVTADAGSPQVVVAARYQSVTEVTAILECGARELIGLPLHLAEAAGRLRSVMRDSVGSASIESPVPGLIGENEAFLAELRKIPVVAACDANVLISGETGTGKELCALAVHSSSPRRARAFVPINCGAIPYDLVENELFGHERGAFTGASHGRPGLVHEADGGTLFLDEINSLPLAAQVKLLRVLQDGSFRSLGSNRVQHVNLRVIAATNDDLHTAVLHGRFRKDLYYRLNVIPIRLPALRERRDDIPRLAQLFLTRYAQRNGKRVCELALDAMTKLSTYGWPGNVRELEHVIERAVVLTSSPVLRAADLSVGTGGTDEESSFQDAKARVVRDFERGYVRSVLSQCRGNISQAAVAAGKDRRAFWELVRKHAINPQDFRSDRRTAPRRLAS